MATIKATVTRVVSDSNFFVTPDDHGHRSVDLEGHRVGSGEISVECHPTELAKGNRAKLRPWRGKLPKVGDKVELQVATQTAASAVDDDDLDPPTEEQIQAEARRRFRARQIQAESEARVAAELKRLEGEQSGGAGGAGGGSTGGAAPVG
jgi:hypothetical protein